MIPGPPPASAAAVATTLLQAVVDYYAAHAGDADNPTEDLPPDRYVAPGNPREVPWDHDTGQVTVAFQTTITGLNALQPPQPMPMRKADPAQHALANLQMTYVIQIVRCQPSLTRSGRVVGSSTLESQALALISDAQHLAYAVLDAVISGALVRESVYAQALVGDVAPLGPMGELAAVELPVTVPLL